MEMTSVEKCQGQNQQMASRSSRVKALDQTEGKIDYSNKSNKLLEEASTKALEQAAQPYLGGNIEIKG